MVVTLPNTIVTLQILTSVPDNQYRNELCDWFKIYSDGNFEEVLNEQKSKPSYDLIKFDKNYIKNN